MSRAWWTLTLHVARRERRERMRTRSFRISTVVLVVGVACAVGIPALVGGGKSASRVGVVGSDTSALAATVCQAGAVLDVRVRPIAFSDQALARKQLGAGDLDAVYVAGQPVLLAQQPAAGTSDAKARLAGAIARLAESPSQTTANRFRALPVRGLKAAPAALSTRLTGLAIVVLIYVLVFVYGQRITSGVVEEKASRVVEVLLASIRPSQLLTGKVLGMGITAFAQMIALLVTALVVAAATGANLLHGAALHVLLVGALWLVLGYALHCTAFAAAGSLITRESDASNVTFPVMLPLLVAYALSFGTIFGGSASAFFKVLAYFPPTAPIASTTLYATGAIGLLQVAIAAAICLAATVATARLAATIYERSILRIGARVRVREVLRGEGSA
ncbi:MAG: ABC transporter permease [Actinomycetota bacterium]|nr:ABC transporter permease [Actinomycetota bacterium]